MKFTLSICNQNAVFLIQFKREIPASSQKQKLAIYHSNCQCVKDVITPHLISDSPAIMQPDWPIGTCDADHLTNQRPGNCVRVMLIIWSKVKVTLTILRRKQVLFSAGGLVSVFLSEICVERRRCALDSILVNLNKTISRFRAMFVLAGHNRNEVFWFPGLSLVNWTQWRPLIGLWWHGKLWPQMIQLFDFYPSLTTLPSLSSSCRRIIISSYLCFRGNFLTWAWYHRPRLCNPDSRGLWEEISGPSHILSNNFVHHINTTSQARDEKWSLKSSSCAHIGGVDICRTFYSCEEIWYEISIAEYKLHRARRSYLYLGEMV